MITKASIDNLDKVIQTEDSISLPIDSFLTFLAAIFEVFDIHAVIIIRETKWR